MRINRFLAHIDGMARQNRFEVEIHQNALKLNMRGMRVSKATIPGRKFTSESYSEIPGGPVRKYPQKVEFDQDISLTFLGDNSLVDRMAIETWMQSMYDGDYNMRYLHNADATSGYYGQVFLRQLDRADFPIYEVELIEAFPEALSGLTLDSSSSAIQDFTVTFGYRRWQSKYENSPSDTILGSLFQKGGRKIKGRINKEIEDAIFRSKRSLASRLGID